MMKMTHLLKTFSCAVLALWLGTACHTTEPVDETFAVESPETISQILNGEIGADSALSIPPNKIILSGEFAEVFFLNRPLYTTLNEEGLVVGKVFAGIRNDGFFVWSLEGIAPYELRYKFIWFDANGNPVKKSSRIMTRSSLPGDFVRFSEVAPSEDCKLFSLCIEAGGHGEEKAE